MNGKGLNLWPALLEMQPAMSTGLVLKITKAKTQQSATVLYCCQPIEKLH